MHFRHLTGIAVLGALAVGAVAWVVAGPAISAGARRVLAGKGANFDIVAMLKEVDRTNTAIIKANDAILVKLQDVKQQAGAVQGVHGRLTRLETGLKEQQQVLGSLEGLTREQAAMSKSLTDLTAGVKPSTAKLAQTAGAQAGALEQMSGMVARQADTMAAIGASNRSIAVKLRLAEELSATVLSRMP